MLNNARIYSARSIYKYLKSECEEVSLATIVKYIGYLKEAYIIDEISKYSNKAKKELSYVRKIYNADVCFNSLRVNNNRYDLDHNLENIVYNELIYMGYTLLTFDNKGKEIDFIATKGNKQFFIQVAYSVVNEKAYEIEFKAFSNLDNEHQKIIITTDSIDYSSSTVKHIQFSDFLKMSEL